MKTSTLIIIAVITLIICSTILLIVFKNNIVGNNSIITTPTPPLYLPAMSRHPAFGEIPIVTQDYQQDINENEDEIDTLQIDIEGTEEQIELIIEALEELDN